jgi:transposase InsO family protein
MGSKLEFLEAADRPGANISKLCREAGISRQTGHKWLRRFRERGYRGLEDESRRPRSSPGMTGPEVVQAVLALRDRHPSWGPAKLVRILAVPLGEDCPSRVTVARLLKSAGKVRKRRPRVRVWHVGERPSVEAKEPNDLWTIDFKGWWRAKNGERCEPFTVRDAMSRMVLAAIVVASTRAAVVRRILEKLFAKHGVPTAMLMDNGAPWISSRSRGGLTKLSAWLVSLGIRLYRSRPASPQDNGGHERMHRDLNELRLSPGRSRRAQQPLCDRWMLDFNHVRPHEALDGKTPAEVYGSPKPRPMAMSVPTYPSGFITRRVLSSGEITMNNDRVGIGRAFVGYLVGLRYEGGLRWRVFFFEIDLGVVEIAGHDLLTTEYATTSSANPKEGTQLVTAVSESP